MPMSKKDYLFVAGCCIVFLGFAFLQYLIDPVISRDGLLYLELTILWYDNGEYFTSVDRWSHLWIPPFYFWLIKLLLHVGIPPEIAGRGISMIFGAMLPCIVFLIMQDIQKDKRISYAAAVLIAVSPTMHELAIEIQRDIVYLALCGWCIYFFLRGILRKERWLFFMCGICYSCSFLTRFETLELFFVFSLAALLLGFGKLNNWKMLFVQMTIFLCSCMISFFSLLYIMGIHVSVLNAYHRFYNAKYVYWQSLYSKNKTELDKKK